MKSWKKWFLLLFFFLLSLSRRIRFRFGCRSFVSLSFRTLDWLVAIWRKKNVWCACARHSVKFAKKKTQWNSSRSQTTKRNENEWMKLFYIFILFKYLIESPAQRVFFFCVLRFTHRQWAGHARGSNIEHEIRRILMCAANIIAPNPHTCCIYVGLTSRQTR